MKFKNVFLIGILSLSLVLSGCAHSSAPMLDQASITNGIPSHWKTYSDEKYGYSIRYPENFEINTENEMTERKDPGTSVKFVFPESFVKTLPEATVSVSAQPGVCANLVQANNGVKKQESVTKNSLVYDVYTLEEGAAGSIYSTIYYTTVKNNICYQVEFFVRETRPENYANNDVEKQLLQEEHSAALSGSNLIFEKMLESFSIKSV